MTDNDGGASEAGHPPILELRAAEKLYPNGVYAVRGVDLKICRGEIHSIVGENGAGKSTAMKLAYGLEHLTAGSILIDGEQRSIASPSEAIKLGIGMVHQNLMLVPSLTVAENIALGAEPGSAVYVSRKDMDAAATELAERTGLPIQPKKKVSEASVGTRQRAAILKALGRGAKVLILDEPTAVLTPQETDDLFAAVRKLRDEGLTVIFISHKLDEVRAISDRISVMRQGKLIATHDVADTTEAGLAAEMVGRSVSLDVERGTTDIIDGVLTVEGLVTQFSAAAPLDLAVAGGEIVGIAGIEDNGQSELMDTLAGLMRPVAGTVRLNGEDITRHTTKQRRRNGVSIVSEDRLRNGAALDLGIDTNLVVDRYDRAPFSSRGVLKPGVVRELAERLMAQFRVKAPDPRVPVSALSGGNMQKVIMARELSSEPTLLLASQPTRGVDIGAQQFVYEQIVAARDTGAAVLLVSADLGELLTLSDRLLVMREGRLVARFDNLTGITEEKVGQHMLGVTADATEGGAQ
ncbi:ABC transporter ATP-binding protein [Microbacterium hominis]|uniref:ABC transporter ATP-binding protein n=1 Tax=Microbacterium hominis TaxID=162426 RepID=A0A7D4U6B0_9MICO|nr:ABC transporter ATP-binding protein [Microbacterium hominis]QKJ18246.1 ABC transporter ATP-binding protein [Microbacterium hominis]